MSWTLGDRNTRCVLIAFLICWLSSATTNAGSLFPLVRIRRLQFEAVRGCSHRSCLWTCIVQGWSFLLPAQAHMSPHGIFYNIFQATKGNTRSHGSRFLALTVPGYRERTTANLLCGSGQPVDVFTRSLSNSQPI